MFTGIVEAVGEVVAIDATDDLTHFTVAAPDIASEAEIGDSVAVNGACLTVTAARGETLCFDAIQETLTKTALGALSMGSRVNLERALLASGRLDGHIVQGHIDGVGFVRGLERSGDDVRLFVGCAPEIAQFLVPKGSVAIDGVSLTVVGVEEAGFDVALIPLTLEKTTLGGLRSGDRVNVEVDVLGKYVRRYLERIVPER